MLSRVPIHVRPLSDAVGLGAFYSPPPGTDESPPLPKGSFVCLYAGEYLTTSEAKRRWSIRHARAGEGNYILTLRLPGQRIHIDPRNKGNVGRFFNHSCDPSCVVHVVRWGGSNVWARAAIFVGTQPRPGVGNVADRAGQAGYPAGGGIDVRLRKCFLCFQRPDCGHELAFNRRDHPLPMRIGQM